MKRIARQQAEVMKDCIVSEDGIVIIECEDVGCVTAVDLNMTKHRATIDVHKAKIVHSNMKSDMRSLAVKVFKKHRDEVIEYLNKASI